MGVSIVLGGIHPVEATQRAVRSAARAPSLLCCVHQAIHTLVALRIGHCHLGHFTYRMNVRECDSYTQLEQTCALTAVSVTGSGTVRATTDN